MSGDIQARIDRTLSTALNDGQNLYEIVETYAAFGDHHTGTEADRLTTEWVAEILQRLGADVGLPSFEFERYVATAALHCDGQTVPSVPVFYSGYGHWQTTSVDVVEYDRRIAGQPTSLDPEMFRPSGSRALAIAIDGPDDQPVQCNRVPAVYGQSTGPGRPAVIIPGNWAERVRQGAQLSFDGSLETATSRNVVATLGSPDDRRVIVTTPLTGWTACAGERGTGLAVALALTAELARDHYVVLVGGSGHELDHLGLRVHLSAQNVEGQPVIHLGSCVGAVDRSRIDRPAGDQPQLGADRRVVSNAPKLLLPGLSERAAAGRWTLVDPEDWPGEGGTWREAGANVLSFFGSFEHFHVATDRPEVATTPDAMTQAATTVIAAARYFLEGTA